MFPIQIFGPDAAVSAEALLCLELLLGERAVDLSAVSDIVTRDGGLKTHINGQTMEPMAMRPTPACTSALWKSRSSGCASL